MGRQPAHNLRPHKGLRQPVNAYFWRTYDKKEIDLVEEDEGRLSGFEFKWKSGRENAPKEWKTAYPGSSFQVINQENYLDFIL